MVHALNELGLDGVVLASNASSVIEFPMDTARNITNAIYSGVFRRHPGLTPILAHAVGALPALGWRIAIHHSTGQGPGDDPAVVEMVDQFVAFDVSARQSESGSSATSSSRGVLREAHRR